MIWYSNGQSMGYALCTRPTILMRDQYIRKQDGVHLSGIQMAFKKYRLNNCDIQLVSDYQPD